MEKQSTPLNHHSLKYIYNLDPKVTFLNIFLSAEDSQDISYRQIGLSLVVFSCFHFGSSSMTMSMIKS